MRKRILFLMVAVSLMFLVTERATVYASEISIDVAEKNLIQLQAQALVNSMNEKELLRATLNDVVDESIPLSVSEVAMGQVEFIPVEGVSQEDVEIETHYTVQRVGVVLTRSGTSSNVYVASVTASLKQEYSTNSKNDIQAWAFVIWIDNLGFDNEFVRAEAIWNYNEGAVLSDRIVEYGTINALLSWVEGPIVDYPEDDYNRYDVGMVGYKFRCSTSIDIANVGTLRCTAVSTVLG